MLNGLYFWNNLGVVKNVEDGWKLLEVKEESKDAGVAHSALSFSSSLVWS